MEISTFQAIEFLSIGARVTTDGATQLSGWHTDPLFIAIIGGVAVLLFQKIWQLVVDYRNEHHETQASFEVKVSRHSPDALSRGLEEPLLLGKCHNYGQRSMTVTNAFLVFNGKEVELTPNRHLFIGINRIGETYKIGSPLSPGDGFPFIVALHEFEDEIRSKGAIGPVSAQILFKERPMGQVEKVSIGGGFNLYPSSGGGLDSASA